MSERTVPGIIPATIDHLRANCPLLGGRVAGAADFRLGLAKYNTAPTVLPFAYVMPLGAESPGIAVMAGGFLQYVRQTIGVVVEFSATADRRGQQPAMDTEAMETCLHAALLNWLPVPCLTTNRQGFWFSGSHFLDLDRARLFFQWDYALNTQIDQDDAWQEPCEDLVGIQLNIWLATKQNMQTDPPAVITEIDVVNGVAPPLKPWPPV
jgi:hypothetical protein